MTEDTKDLLRRADRISGDITLNGVSLDIIPEMAAKIRALEAERDELREECSIIAAKMNLAGYVPGAQLDHLNLAKKQTARMIDMKGERDKLRKALHDIMYKAGSHTVPAEAVGDPTDPSFAGIYEIARAALEIQPEGDINEGNVWKVVQPAPPELKCPECGGRGGRWVTVPDGYEDVGPFGDQEWRPCPRGCQPDSGEDR